jgi:hypothetical protein
MAECPGTEPSIAARPSTQIINLRSSITTSSPFPTTNHQIEAQTQRVLHHMTLRQTSISRHREHMSGAQWMRFAPRIEFPRGAHDWCIVITPTVATTSGVRVQEAAKACPAKLENPRALAPFHTTGITPRCKTRPSGSSPRPPIARRQLPALDHQSRIPITQSRASSPGPRGPSPRISCPLRQKLVPFERFPRISQTQLVPFEKTPRIFDSETWLLPTNRPVGPPARELRPGVWQPPKKKTARDGRRQELRPNCRSPAGYFAGGNVAGIGAAAPGTGPTAGAAAGMAAPVGAALPAAAALSARYLKGR